MSRIEAYLSALIIALFAPFILPASPVFDVHSLHYDSPARSLVQDRTAAWQVNADWRAWIYEESAGGWRNVCYGSGDAATYEAGRIPQTLGLDVWVGDPDCTERLTPGKTYRARGAWTLHFLIWSWTETAEAPPFIWP